MPLYYPIIVRCSDLLSIILIHYCHVKNGITNLALEDVKDHFISKRYDYTQSRRGPSTALTMPMLVA